MGRKIRTAFNRYYDRIKDSFASFAKKAKKVLKPDKNTYIVLGTVVGVVIFSAIFLTMDFSPLSSWWKKLNADDTKEVNISDIDSYEKYAGVKLHFSKDKAYRKSYKSRFGDDLRYKREKPFKFILIMSHPIYRKLFSKLGMNQTTFIKRNCIDSNCFITINELRQTKHITELEYFDAIVFYGPAISYDLGYEKQNRRKTLKEFNANIPLNSSILVKRFPHQKYIFTSQESSSYHPLCFEWLESFFNWTWSYKLNSDILFSYLIIRNMQGHVIGPREEMHWMKFEEMIPLHQSIKDKEKWQSKNKYIKKKLRMKSKTAAWFVSNCITHSKREKFVKNLQTELKQYRLKIDIYGDCGPYICEIEDNDVCWKMIERDYFFYLSFEDSFVEDFVTEKLLNPLQHYTVPIVYGGANYTRFMPDGIYLNARELGAKKLAKEMYEISRNSKRYLNFFMWHHYYSYHAPEERRDTDPYCRLCSLLNDEKSMQKVEVYDRFRAWWNVPGKCVN